MKVLLVCQAYPPHPIVGAFRPYRIARAFQAAGHQVTVVTERLPDDLEAKRPRDEGIEIRSVDVGLRYRERAIGILNRFRGRGREDSRTPRAATAIRTDTRTDTRTMAEANGASTGTASGNGKGGLLRRLVLSLLWLPDDEQRFIRPAMRASRDLLADVDLIYTTAPSWSTHVVGLLLRRRTRKRWVADFRDPWLEIAHERPDRPRTALTDRILHRLERSILREADYVVAVAEKTRAALAAKVPPAERGKFLLARNGIDVVHPPRHDRVPGPFRIAYTGSFYDDRDPRLFLHALALLRTRRELTPETLRVDFAGACREMNGFSVEHLVVQLGLDDLVHFHDWMPRADVQRMLAVADLLLVLARGMELQVPNKLYEYLGMRLPIFAWADEAGETAAVLRSIEGHFVVTSADVEEMARALERALDTPPRAIESPVQERILEEWNAERQMTRLVEAVGMAPAARVA